MEKNKEEAVKKIVAEVRHKPVIAKMLERLRRDLPAHLYYHTAEHTDDVLHEAVMFAYLDGLSAREIELLAVAAAYHDAGFIVRQFDNEAVGALLAEHAMREDRGFSDSEIEDVRRMILDTKLNFKGDGPLQQPSRPLSKYLLDADVSNFGREDFFEKGELERREEGEPRQTFIEKTINLLEQHQWLTTAAVALRGDIKQRNTDQLKALAKKFGDFAHKSAQLTPSQTQFLLRLPLALNTSLDTPRIVKVALDHIKKELQAEAGTIFLLSDNTKELNFWALEGSEELRLAGTKMPADQGIVGWVIQHKTSQVVNDVAHDPRFFGVIDKEGKFKTRNMVCAPLLVRGEALIGAIQVLNRQDDFTDAHVGFLEHAAQHVALAIDNARLFETVKGQKAALEALDRRKEEVLTLITHEFRTPLNIIQSSAEMLVLLKDDKRRERMQESLRNGIMRLTRLMSQLRGMSGLKDETAVTMGSVALSVLFSEIRERFAEAISKRKHKFEIEIDKNIGQVWGDEGLLTIVIMNLVSNAIRFTPDGGTIRLSAKKQSGLVTIAVRDSGIGIEKSQIPLIFEKFYEVQDILQHSSGEFEFRSGGMGLGLAAVKSIISAHGSSVEVWSELNKGSEFRFTLREAV